MTEFQQYWINKFEIEFNFSILTLMIMNTHVFDSTLPPRILAKNINNFIQNIHVKKFIDIFNKKFNTNLKDEIWFLSAVYIFFKDSTLNLDTVLTSQYLNIEPVDTDLKIKVKDVFDQWNTYDIKGTDKNIEAFCSRIAPFIKKQKYEKVLIVSSDNFDGNIISNIISHHIKRNIEIEILSTYQLNEYDSNADSLILLEDGSELPEKVEVKENIVLLV